MNEINLIHIDFNRFLPHLFDIFISIVHYKMMSNESTSDTLATISGQVGPDGHRHVDPPATCLLYTSRCV